MRTPFFVFCILLFVDAGLSYLNVHLTVVSPEARETATLVARHPVQTGPVIEAGGGEALVHVDLRQAEGDQIITLLLLWLKKLINY